MNTVRTLAATFLFALPLLFAVPAHAQRVDNANGTSTYTPAGGTPITLSTALLDEIVAALQAGSDTEVSEAIADLISDNQAAFTADTGLLAGLAAIASTIDPLLGDAVAQGALEGASQIDVLTPAIAAAIGSAVTGAGGTLSAQTQNLIDNVVVATGEGSEDGADGDEEENPATAEAGSTPSPT